MLIIHLRTHNNITDDPWDEDEIKMMKMIRTMTINGPFGNLPSFSMQRSDMELRYIYISMVLPTNHGQLCVLYLLTNKHGASPRNMWIEVMFV